MLLCRHNAELDACILQVRGQGYYSWPTAVRERETQHEENDCATENALQQQDSWEMATSSSVEWQCNGCPHHKHKPTTRRINVACAVYWDTHLHKDVKLASYFESRSSRCGLPPCHADYTSESSSSTFKWTVSGVQRLNVSCQLDPAVHQSVSCGWNDWLSW